MRIIPAIASSDFDDDILVAQKHRQSRVAAQSLRLCGLGAVLVRRGHETNAAISTNVGVQRRALHIDKQLAHAFARSRNCMRLERLVFNDEMSYMAAVCAQTTGNARRATHSTLNVPSRLSTLKQNKSLGIHFR
jgi:hypothetical protein